MPATNIPKPVLQSFVVSFKYASLYGKKKRETRVDIGLQNEVKRRK